MGDGVALPCEVTGADDTHILAVQLGHDAFAGDVADVGSLGNSQVSFLHLGYDAVGDGVLGVAFSGCSKAEFFILVPNGQQYGVEADKTALGTGGRKRVV